MVYHRYSWKVLWVLLRSGKGQFWKTSALVAKHSEAQTGCPVTYTYTDATVRELLAGFAVGEIRKAHIFTWDIDAYKRYEYRKASEWANVSGRELAELERELGWHLLVKAALS